MDDYDTRFAPGYGTEFTPNSTQFHDASRHEPELALQEVSASVSKPSIHAIRTGPPIADYRQKKKRRSPVHDSGLGEDLATMIVKGCA
jgi:hypothetical protein